MPTKEPSWIERNWKWFIPAVVLGMVGCLAVFIGLIAVFVFGTMKSSEPYQGALQISKQSEAVQAKLGAPLKEGFFVSGNINISGPSGEASLEIPISGPKGSGIIYVEAKRQMGKWYYPRLIVEIKASGERIPLQP